MQAFPAEGDTKDAVPAPGSALREGMVGCLLSLPLNLILLVGTVFAVAVTLLVAGCVSYAMIGEIPPVVWVCAVICPLAVAPLELVVLTALIGRMRDEMTRRRQAERDMADDALRRRQAESQLRDNAEKLQAMFRRSPLGMARTSLDGRLLDANPAFLSLVGRDRDELSRLTIWDVTPVRHADAEARMMERLEVDGHYGPVEKEILGPEGRRVPVRVSGALITDGGESYLWSVIEDITEDREAEAALLAKTEALARSNADLEQFAFIASHDLREPLRMVSAYMGLLEKRFGGVLNNEGLEYLSFAKEGAKRMDRLVLDLLEYSRVGRGEGVAVPVPLDRVLDDVEGMLAPALAECGGRLERSGSLPVVRGDRADLFRLLAGLLENCIKYRTPARSLEIVVSAARQGEGWTVSVADNGIGIDPEFHERIFRIFQRLHPRDSMEGTGIGLAMAKRIVERRGGRIWVESLAGAGATFRFTVPD